VDGWADGWIAGWVGSGWYVTYGRIGERRERARGEYRFSSLVKQKKKRKITLSFTSPEKEKYFFYIYDVITWEK
jgi:hypothetical protein